MLQFNTAITGHGNKTYHFECYENTEPIEMGDKYIYFFGGLVDVQICETVNEKYEINKNDRINDFTCIDFVTGFWKNCYKIKNTNFKLGV